MSVRTWNRLRLARCPLEQCLIRCSDTSCVQLARHVCSVCRPHERVAKIRVGFRRGLGRRAIGGKPLRSRGQSQWNAARRHEPHAVARDNDRHGSRRRFLSDVDRTFARIRERPFQFPSVTGDVRRALLHTFPYAVYFRIQRDGRCPRSAASEEKSEGVARTLHGSWLDAAPSTSKYRSAQTNLGFSNTSCVMSA